MYIPVLGCGCHPQTVADGIGGHWTTWAKHLVNGVSCWHHAIHKVSNPDVPVLGCGCHPRAAGAGSIVHGSSDLLTLGNSCDCRKGHPNGVARAVRVCPACYIPMAIPRWSCVNRGICKMYFVVSYHSNSIYAIKSRCVGV